MNEGEVRELYEELSELYGVPMPTYIVYDRRPEIITPRVIPQSWSEQVLLKITISRKVGAHFQLRDIAEDPFGFIMLSKGRRGIRKDEAVHEFYHYLDYLIDFFTGTRPVDEASVRSRTRECMKNVIIRAFTSPSGHERRKTNATRDKTGLGGHAVTPRGGAGRARRKRQLWTADDTRLLST